MWSQLECGYDSANETIVFGSRQIAEGDALYETSTIAVIRTEGQTTKNPSVQCMSRNGKILLAINDTFRILSNGCTSLDYMWSFESTMNNFNMSLDDQILIVCLNDGNVQCLHVPSNGKIICSALISENINGSTFSIFVANDEDSNSFIICTSNNIYRLKINKIQDVYNQLNDDVDDLNVDFTFDKLNINVNSSLTSFRYENNLFYTSNQKCFADCNKLLIGLDEEGSIIGICKLTKMIFKLYNRDLFKDIMVLKSINSDDHRFLVSSTNENSSYVSLLSFPNFETIYNLKVSEHTYLVTISNDQDEEMFIEGFCTKGSEFVNELRLKVITESNPEVKLKRLLRRKCFQEAKKFARTFCLDMQQIYIAEAEEYIIKNDFQITDVNEFCQILDSINDIIFIVDQCLINTTADTLDNIEKMLKYAYNRLQTILQNNPDDTIFNKYKNTILNLFFKLDTFKLIHCNEDFSNSELLMDSWVHFSSLNFFDEMCNYLKNDKLDKCTLLFTRLQQENILDSEKIQNILNLIPLQNSITNFLPLLRHILLFSFQAQPECLPIIINWIYNIVLRFDTSKSGGLEYLLNFCEHINKFLYEHETQNLSFQKNIIQDGCLNKFRHLLTTLNELYILKRDFGIKLSVDDYMQEPDAVIQLLLDEISLKQLENFMNNFVFKYCNQYRISGDEVLSHYIKFISGTQKSYWDETVICLIPFISSNTLRMETILIVLESSDVPWSKTVEQLAKQGSEECHPLATKVKSLKENIPWKMLLKKYSIPDNPSYDNDDVVLIMRKILMNSKSDMLEDLDVVATKYAHLKDRLQILCFNNFVQKGKMENALKYLSSIKEEIIINCFDSAMLFAQSFIFSNIPNNTCVNNYLEILSSLLLRLEKFLSEHEYEVYFNGVKILKNIYLLKQKYNCDEILNLDYDLSSLLPKLIKNIITPVHEDTINWIEVVKKCEQLSHLLQISKEKCFFELEKQTNNLESLIYSAEIIIKSDSSALNMCAIAVLLMKNIDNHFMDKNFSQNGFNSLPTTFNNDDISKALRLVNKLSLNACIKADKQELQTACEILNWSNGCFWIKKSNNSLPQLQISSLFQPENSCSLSNPSVVKDYFSLLLKIARDRIILPSHLKEEIVDPSLLEEQLLNQIESLPDKMKQLHIEGHDLAAYQLLNVIKIEMMTINNNSDFLIRVMQKINFILNSRCVPQLLDKIFVCKTIDQPLAFSLFLSPDFQPSQWFLPALKKYKMQVKKLYATSSLACSYLELRRIPGEAMIKLKYRCKWWQKFLHRCVPYSDLFQLDPDVIVSSYLLMTDEINLKILKEFCLDFGLSIQMFLPQYLRNSLVHWKPKIEDGNISGQEELFQKCKEIISEIENKIVAVAQLNSAWSEISYYQHEVYLCILELFVTLEESCTNPDKGVLLIFLKDYRRIKNPQQKEIDDWQTKYPFARDIDPLSEYRLPYFLEMCTNDFWEIIRPEINLLTYDTWFTNAPYLDLDRNHICIFAIKGTINSGVLNSKESNWSINSKHNSLLESMEMCVRQITDLKQATAVLYQAVKKVTGGADQVYIAEMCWKKALQWKNCTSRTSSDSESDIQLKCSEVQRKYLNCLKMHILYTYNLGTERYLSIIENTEQLIKQLYQDESIIERTKGTVMFYPDINDAVDELASQLGMDLVPIRTSLITDLLQKSSFDDSFCIPSPKNDSLAEDNIDSICDNLKRVIYICESKNAITLYNLLCNISFAKLDETISKFGTSPDLSMRVKSLQCLLVITKNVEELAEMIGELPSSYLNKLQILLSLETLGISLSVYELDNCNKMDLTTKILRTKSSDPTVVKSLAKLCAIYNIWDSKLWNKIVQCFTDLKMFTDLQEWLPKLYNCCHSPNLDCPFVSGWTCLIKNSFLKALDDGKNYSHGFLLIQMCPIVTMLESCFLDIFNIYFENNLFEISAMFLPYVQGNETKSKILEALSSKKNSELYEKIECLSFQGLLNTENVIRILKSY